jgi:pimeloyl-ACP methyl ester carboxylesterase
MPFEPTERRAKVAGTEVLWREAEPRTRAPVLYVHGVPTDGSDWLPFLERTGGIALDLPGFGRSDKSAAFDYSIAGYAAFLRAFADQLGLERFSLVVHDWGSVGLALAQDVPERIERIVVIDAVPFLPGYRWHPVARVWRTRVAGELLMGSSSRWMTRQILRRMRAMPEEAIGPLVERTWPHFDHGTQRAILRLYRSAPPDVLARAGERLGDITAPARVIWGKADPFIPSSFAQAYADALGGQATLDLLAGAGHWPWLDEPYVVEAVATFLDASPG